MPEQKILCLATGTANREGCSFLQIRVLHLTPPILTSVAFERPTSVKVLLTHPHEHISVVRVDKVYYTAVFCIQTYAVI